MFYNFLAPNRWGLGPAVVNAFYGTDINEMMFPAAILQGQFYTHGVPDSMNFGAIGIVIGHELTHGFDDRGSQYDADGMLRQWWSSATRKRFEKKAKCFVEQYSSILEPMTNMTLNGKNTVGENIADNGGIRLAFKAYEHLLQTSKTEDIRLPGLERFSGKHLFFIASAMIWCSHYRKEALQHLIEYDPHSPKKFRVNVPLKNFEGFSKVFKCKKTSPMHPGNKKCVLW